jgi:hypothetical protein
MDQKDGFRLKMRLNLSNVFRDMAYRERSKIAIKRVVDKLFIEVYHS